MATDHTETAGAQGTERGDDAGTGSRAMRMAKSLTNRGGNGRAAMTAGSFLLARAVRTIRRSRRRAVAMGLAGAALLGVGLRQRRSGGGSDTEGSTEATAHLEQSEVLHQSETNPRGTSGEPGVETQTDPDEGSIQFSEDQPGGPRSEPHLDEEGAHDPRMEDEDDAVEIDLSEASMADEASEAAGPTPEQAQPSSTEGTEPEPTPEEDVSHMEADQPSDESGEESDAASDDRDEDDEAE